MKAAGATNMEAACHFAYTHDREDADANPCLSSKLGFWRSSLQRDVLINKSTSTSSQPTVERLTLVENLLRLGIFEITSFDTPSASSSSREAIELAKNFSDQKSARLIVSVNL